MRTRRTRPTLPAPPPCPRSTYDRTAKRSYEKAYWQTIAKLATGRFKNKDNADCVLDPQTRKRLAHHHRDLEALGDYLLAHYAKVAAAAGMTDQVLVGELPFRWQTDFQFSWSGGWKLNQEGETYERDLVIVIPGKNRRRAVIMADHYDTAYMEDVYGYSGKGGGPRIAAAGADDNHSATAAMMLAAPIFLDLARQGKLETDIWLVHLTGEEFPSDCMGARALCQQVVEGSLKIRLTDGRWKSLAKTRVEGVYVMDMIAHNNDREKDVFQIAPGVNRESMLLAEEAHAATEIWNASTPAWNRRAERRGAVARQAIGRRRHDSRRGLAPALERRGAAALLSPQRLVQHRRPDLLRRRRARRLVHGELRHQSPGLSRHARHDGEHRSRLRRRGERDRHRVGGAGGREER